MDNIIQEIAVYAIPVLFAITVHEAAHGYVARMFGDNTAYVLGRVTLNPVKHIDLLGTIVIPLGMVLLTGFMFGWAKPVPVNPRNFRRYRRGDIMVSLAGVSANILLAAAFTVVAVGVGHLGRAYPGALAVLTPLQSMATAGIVINLILAFFNLIPIPPLDGSRIVAWLLPYRLQQQWHQLEQLAPFLLIGVFAFGGRLVSGPIYAVTDLLLGLARTLALA